MLRNYLLIALRNLGRNKLYTFINIAGLSVGITCFMLIAIYARDEFAYDRYHSKADRIYRLVEIIDLEGQGEESSSNPFPTGPAMQNDFPDLIEGVVRFFDFQVEKQTLSIEDKKYAEADVFFADSNAFQLFDFPLKRGNPDEALRGPNKIILTQEMARKYFGEKDPMGRQIKFDGYQDLIVSGIFDEIPSQSHFHFQALISFPTLKVFLGPNLYNNWVWNPNWTYILLKEGKSPEDLEARFPAFVQKYYPGFLKEQVSHYLQPLTAIHLHSNLDYEIEPNGDADQVWILLAIGVFILMIAGINFMNLSTARSARRSREVGMRKVLGAQRQSLITQFLGESIIVSLLAVVVSPFLVSAILPIFNQLAGKSMALSDFFQPEVLLVMIVVGVVLGVFSGLYPAFYLSSFEAVSVLKGQSPQGPAGQRFRQGLVVLQFALSLVLIIATMVIWQQFNFLTNSSTGFSEDQIVVVPTKYPMLAKLEVFKEMATSHSGIKSVTTMNEVLGVHHNIHEFRHEGLQPGTWVYYPALMVDEDFLETFDLELVAGRNFFESPSSDDTAAVIVNETMTRNLGYTEPKAALGQRLETPRGKERIVGVVKDFHFVSLKDRIRPFVLDIAGEKGDSFFSKNLAIKLTGGQTDAAMEHLEKVWGKVAPMHPFEYSFLDQQLDRLYKSESQLGQLVTYFAILAIFIACLGLFALSAFTAEQRTREIGIRKVLGASESVLISMLARDFLKLVLVANLLAWPLAWFLINRWLEGFAYHVSLSLGTFILAATAVGILALGTIIFQSIKASRKNPVMALREE